MRKPGLLLFLIGFLLVIIAVMIYLATNLPKIPVHAKLVLAHYKINKV